MVTIGKEHLGFWKLEKNKIVELNVPNYEVIYMFLKYAIPICMVIY